MEIHFLMKVLHYSKLIFLWLLTEIATLRLILAFNYNYLIIIKLL